jgi:hypothetical protein
LASCGDCQGLAPQGTHTVFRTRSGVNERNPDQHPQPVDVALIDTDPQAVRVAARMEASSAPTSRSVRINAAEGDLGILTCFEMIFALDAFRATFAVVRAFPREERLLAMAPLPRDART